MAPTTTLDLVRLVSTAVRTVDAHLARTAAANAAGRLGERSADEVSTQRTLRDLRRLSGAADELVLEDYELQSQAVSALED